MKFELFLLIVCSGLIYNTYHDNKLLKKIIGIQDWASPGALEFFKTL